MDTPSNGGRDSRYLTSYDISEMPILNADTSSEIYQSSPLLHNRQTSISSGLCRSTSVSLNANSCANSTSITTGRGIKRTHNDMCYDPITNRGQTMLTNDCNADIMEDKYSPNSHQKNSPLSNGKKTKGRVKIKMEYIDNKLRRYTTFSKRKTGIMKKAYELSTLTGTQVMLLVASETGHVYTFATRKLQPMITSEAGKALIQTCLNSPDPCPSGSGDQRMSATGFEETELSYNIGDDEKADSSSCSPYRSDSSDSSDVEESVSGSPSSSPPPLISLQDFQSSSTAAAAAVAAAASSSTATNATKTHHKNRSNSINRNSKKTIAATNAGIVDIKDEYITSDFTREMATANGSGGGGGGGGDNNVVNFGSNARNSPSVDLPYGVVGITNSNSSGPTGGGGGAGGNVSVTNAATPLSDLLAKNGNVTTPNGFIFTLEQLQREFGVHTTSLANNLSIAASLPQFVTIPLLSNTMSNAASTATANPPAAHQTPADLSNKRSRK